MSNEGQLSPAWKAIIVLTLFASVAALGVSAFGGRPDPRTQDHQQRIRALESKVQEIQATGAGTRPKDPSYGE